MQNLPPTTLVIFGITGDLAQRKLLPALYNLASYGMLPDSFRIVGATRQTVTNTEILQRLPEFIKTVDTTVVNWLADRLDIATMDLLDANDYVALGNTLNKIEDTAGVCMHRLFYLAIPAQTYAPVVERLADAGLNQACQHGTGDSRLLIEKPFGFDTQSAKDLIAILTNAFAEKQTYRIDHYLAKETAQNILTFRFNNAVFRGLWSNKHIQRITITAAETLGIEGRVTFYEQTGALRDLIQSHLLQLLALVTMEEPTAFRADAIHKQKQALLQAITPIAPNMVAKDAIRGQYDGYRSEVQNDHSATETFAAIRLEIANERWRGVPIIIQTGKALAEKLIQITVVFGEKDHPGHTNTLNINIQPNEGIDLQLLAKEPGFTQAMHPVSMAFRYDQVFAKHTHPDAYERVLSDAIRGDRALFTTSDEVLVSWRIVEHVLSEWSKNGADLHVYQKGSNGPDVTDLNR